MRLHNQIFPSTFNIFQKEDGSIDMLSLLRGNNLIRTNNQVWLPLNDGTSSLSSLRLYNGLNKLLMKRMYHVSIVQLKIKLFITANQ